LRQDRGWVTAAAELGDRGRALLFGSLRAERPEPADDGTAAARGEQHGEQQAETCIKGPAGDEVRIYEGDTGGPGVDGFEDNEINTKASHNEEEAVPCLPQSMK